MYIPSSVNDLFFSFSYIILKQKNEKNVKKDLFHVFFSCFIIFCNKNPVRDSGGYIIES